MDKQPIKWERRFSGMAETVETQEFLSGRASTALALAITYYTV